MRDEYPDPREEDIYAGDRRISRPDSSLPDWYIADAAYRPIPIAWFAGALVLQVIAMPLVYLITSGFGPLLVIGASALVSGAIGVVTWQRGIAAASGVWKVATVAMLAFFLGVNCLAALA